MKVGYVLLISVMTLAACKKPSGSEDFSSALDPVGENHKNKLISLNTNEKFKPGDKISLRNPKILMFPKNPQLSLTKGDVVEAVSATVILTEGLFVKVHFDDGKTGFISESDILDPNETFDFGTYDYTDSAMMPAFLQDDSLPAPAAAGATEENAAPNTETPKPAAVKPVDTSVGEPSDDLPTPSNKL